MICAFWASLFLLIGLFGAPAALAQPVAPPALPQPPLWTGNFPGDSALWTNPEDACKAQHDYYNPGATLGPTTYTGGRTAACNWTLNPNSNTILPALATGYCRPNYQMTDQGTCVRADAQTDGRAQCRCGDGAVSGSATPQAGNPIALNYGAKIDREVDYASAEARFSVVRDYYSLGEDYVNVSSPTAVAGFGARWHGVVPGRLAVSGSYAERIEYLAVDGSFAIFSADDSRDTSIWTWHTYGATRRRLSMTPPPTSSRTDFLYSGAPVVNGPGEIRMDMAQGEYILFRRAAGGGAGSGRYLVPVERGWADGYKIFYAYPDSGEFPNVVSDSLGRQMTLTWADAPRDTHLNIAIVLPVKVISTIALPDGTSLQYNYGKDFDARGSKIKDRLEGVQRLSSTGGVLWARSYLYENSSVPYALTGKLDQNGNRLSTYTYDAAGLATSTELAGGVNKVQIENLEDTSYGAKFIRKLTNPLGYRRDFTFFKEHNWGDAQRVLKTVDSYAAPGIDAGTSTFNYFGYVGDMAIADFTDGAGNVVNFDVDSQLRPTVTREAVGTVNARTTTTTWDPVFDLPKSVVAPGLTTDYTYSATGQLSSVELTDTTTTTAPYATAGQKRKWTYTWNGNGRLSSVNGPKGLDANGYDDVMNFTYDSAGNLLTSNDALGHLTTFTNYDANGRPGKMTDPNGVDTVFAYDALGRLASATRKDPTGVTADATTALDYDVEGRVTVITLPATDKMFIDYDIAGRVTAVRAASGEQVAFSYDAMSNVTNRTVKRADGTTARSIARTFDQLGRLTSVTLGPNRTTAWAYDKLGNIQTVTSARANVTTRAFDGLNRLISTVAPDAGTTAAGYDGRNNTVSFTDGALVTTNVVRDGFGEVILEDSPDRGTSIYYYDAAGARIASIDGRGQRLDLVRDALGRITSKTPAGRPASETVTYVYDSAGIAGSYGVGRLSSVTDASGTTSFKYDYRGNILTKQQTVGSGSANLGYSYDLADRITSMTYPSGRSVRYTRDSKGRVVTIATKAYSGAGLVTLASGMTYEPFGSLNNAVFGNGLNLLQKWDDGRLTAKRLRVNGTNAIRNGLLYTYDNDDNITAITSGMNPSVNVSYAYDVNGRLSQAVTASGTVKRTDYIYDKNGNIATVAYRYNAGDASPFATDTYGLTSGTNRLATLTSATGARAFSYDGRGNLSGELRPGALSITAGYDGYARLTSYQTGSTVLSNAYNGLDDRVSTATTMGGTTDTRIFVYDNDGRLLGEYGASATDVRAETIWMSPDAGGAASPWGGDDGVGGYAPLAIATGNGAGTAGLYWVHGNHLGVPISITDASGTNATLSGFTVVGFPGQTRTLADLYYNRYRDYDPTTGRYIQADPIGLSGGANPYLYANGNPVRFADPTGRNPIIIGIVVGALIGAGIDLLHQWWPHRFESCPTWKINWWEVGGAAAIGGALGGLGGGLPGFLSRIGAGGLGGELGGGLGGSGLGGEVGGGLGGDIGGGLGGDLGGGIGGEAGGGSVGGDIAGGGGQSLLPESESQLGHIFRDEAGHIVDTPANRALLDSVASDPAAVLGTDQYGATWSARILENGTQVWTRMINGRIVNGGVNATPRPFNPGTGLSSPIKP